jgi:hypothetical protein
VPTSNTYSVTSGSDDNLGNHTATTDLNLDSNNITNGGTITATSFAGTLTTAAQTNITSVGTLDDLTVTGDVTIDTNSLFVDASGDNVGVGTATPDADAKLDVAGAVKISASDTETCDSALTGTLRFSGGQLQICTQD